MHLSHIFLQILKSAAVITILLQKCHFLISDGDFMDDFIRLNFKFLDMWRFTVMIFVTLIWQFKYNMDACGPNLLSVWWLFSDLRSGSRITWEKEEGRECLQFFCILKASIYRIIPEHRSVFFFFSHQSWHITMFRVMWHEFHGSSAKKMPSWVDFNYRRFGPFCLAQSCGG